MKLLVDKMTINEIKDKPLSELCFEYGFSIVPFVAKQEQNTRKITERRLRHNQTGYLLFKDIKGGFVKRRPRKYEFCNECHEKAFWDKTFKLYKCNNCKNVMTIDLKSLFTDKENPMKTKFIKKNNIKKEEEKYLQEIKDKKTDNFDDKANKNKITSEKKKEIQELQIIQKETNNKLKKDNKNGENYEKK